MRPNLSFDTDFREIVRLADDNRVLLRPLVARDKPHFRAAFERLSKRSRYRRFFQNKPDLSAEELRFLTEVDGWDHFAIAAFAIGDDGVERELLGGARLYRLPEEQTSAEMAFAVVDHAQHRGIGRLMLTRLVAAASERGIKKLYFYVLAENVPARKLLSHWRPKLDGIDEVIAGELQVPEVACPDCTDGGGEFLDQLEVLLALLDVGALPTPVDMAFKSLDCWRTQADEILKDRTGL